MKKNILFIALLLCIGTLQAQDYLDIFKASFSSTSLGNVDDENAQTDVTNTNVELYMPIPITQKAVILAGFTYQKLTKESFDLSKTNRKASDQKAYEAEQVMKKLESLANTPS